MNSCNDDILDLKPLDSVSEEDVWKDLNLIELYVNDRYNELPHGYTQWAGGLRMTGITDESYHMHEARFLDKYTQGGLTSGSLNMYYFNGFWLDAYQAIRNQNIFIENINTYQASDDEQARIKQLTAEIRFLRAYFYNELISRYGGVPLITETFNINSDFDVPRASFDECVEFIVSELDEVIEDLPNKDEATGGDFGRLTKGAAIGLKIRALTMHASPLFNPGNVNSRWQLVAEACEELFALNQYSLSSNYKDIFLNPMDSEVIMFKQFLNQFGFELVDELSDFYYHYRGGHNINEWRFPNGDGGWISENPRQEFVDQYETLNGEIPVLGYQGNPDNLQPIINPSSGYNPQNPYVNRDPRLRYSVLYDNTPFKGRNLEMWDGGRDSRDPDVDFWWNGHVLGYGIRKGLDESWNLNDGVSGQQPWVYMRLSEFYLTYAEAQYHLGNASTAVEYVNYIRQRPGVNMPPVNASGDLLAKIKHERTIELAFEGNRWYDARRWLDAETDFAKDIVAVDIQKNPANGNKTFRYFLFEGETGLRSFPENHYLWPIPIEEILKSNLQQNPGY
jgi:hypothetical protein